MAYGLMTWDENGVVQIEPSAQIGKVLQIVGTNAASGSISDGRAEGQQIWVAFLRPTNMAQDSFWFFGSIAPRLTVSGVTVSWSYSSDSRFNNDCLVYFGVK